MWTKKNRSKKTFVGMLCETQNSVFHIEKNIRFPCSLYYKKLTSHK